MLKIEIRRSAKEHDTLIYKRYYFALAECAVKILKETKVSTRCISRLERKDKILNLL